MKIRTAKIKDVDWIVELFIEESRKKPYNENWNKKIAKQKILEDFKNNKVFILDDKTNIGFIMLRETLWEKEKIGHIELIIVSSKNQGKGYGKKLLDFSENFFKKKGIKRSVLYSEKGSVAFDIYKKRDYKETNLVMMEKNLK